MEIQTKAKIKQWGNSLGIVIPKDIVIKEDLKPEDEVQISVKKRKNLKGFFGKGRELKIDSQKMKDESRKIWEM